MNRMDGVGQRPTVRRILDTRLQGDHPVDPGASEERQASDDPIGLRYPIRVYESGQSSHIPAPSFRLLFKHKGEGNWL
jgi:hypothetical protein